MGTDTRPPRPAWLSPADYSALSAQEFDALVYYVGRRRLPPPEFTRARRLDGVSRYSLTEQERERLVLRFLDFADLVGDRDAAEGLVDAVLPDLEEVRRARAEARAHAAGLVGYGWYLDQDEQGALLRFDAATFLEQCACAPASAAGRPADELVKLRRLVIARVYGALLPGAATLLAQSTGGGQRFEALVAVLFELAGVRLSNLRREVLEAVKALRIERG